MVQKVGSAVIVLVLGAFAATSLIVNLVVFSQMRARLDVQDKKIKVLCDALHTEYMAPKGY